MDRRKFTSKRQKYILLYEGAELTKIYRAYRHQTGADLPGFLLVQAELDWLLAKHRDARDYYERVALVEYQKLRTQGYSVRVSWFYAARAGRVQWNKQYNPYGMNDDLPKTGRTWKQVMAYKPKNRLLRIAS